ncbi:MAG: hypothetical protein ACOVOV_02525 [Dolichospermum sp.]
MENTTSPRILPTIFLIVLIIGLLLLGNYFKHPEKYKETDLSAYSKLPSSKDELLDSLLSFVETNPNLIPLYCDSPVNYGDSYSFINYKSPSLEKIPKQADGSYGEFKRDNQYINYYKVREKGKDIDTIIVVIEKSTRGYIITNLSRFHNGKSE